MSQPPRQILELVARFRENLSAYKSPQYNEAQLRKEFLDPFFKELGWDMENKEGYSEAYKEVIHEDAIKMGEGHKAPDYCFRVGGTRKFFVEAKKPSVDIQNDASPAFQLRRYAFTESLPLSILSDFEEFIVYDGRVRPNKHQNAEFARVLCIPYTEYETRWEEIANVFSREAVLKGRFDKYAESVKAKRGTSAIDDDFLETIETWRLELAANLALRNQNLTQRELNFAVQRIIDRIIFLRICEDRGIEIYGRLLALANGERIYPRLGQIFEQADDRFNSGLFHFKREKGRQESPDELTPGLEIDDKLLRDILKSLYYPDSPYVFSRLPADVLGHVYEQFLGKVIRLTEGHRAKVEDKPEVKKAHGVYYTPTYIVEYIVRNTVGKLVEGKTPRQAAKLKILDPACGSGSFLLGAYEFLLNWHLEFYTAHEPDKLARGSKPMLVRAAGGGWKLAIAERKRILLDNIYGVDIDAQAVETTKLSLLLKVLEGETQQSLQSVFRTFQERALPDLGRNIKCGNSLIGPDFYQQQELTLLDEEERYRINVFDWQAEFPRVFQARPSSSELHETPAPADYPWAGEPLHGSYSYRKKKIERIEPRPWPVESEWEGGFDAVIGNPPYVLLQSLGRRAIFDFLANNYRTARYKIDTYQVFIEKGVMLAREGGQLGFITPNTFLRNKYAKELRGLILEDTEVEILRVFYYPVFRGASVDTLVMLLSKSAKPNPKHKVQVIRSRAPDEPLVAEAQLQNKWAEHPELNFSLPGSAGSEDLAGKLSGKSCRLGEFATAYFGIQTFDRETFVKPHREAKHFKPAIDGTNIQRYVLLPSSEFVDFRPKAIKSGGKQQVYEQERIGVRQIGEAPIATLVPAGIYSLNTIYNIFFTKPAGYKLRFILGLILSRALGWYWRQSFFDQKETFPKIKKESLLSIPVPRINFGNASERFRHDQVVKFVELILELQKRLSAARTPQERISLQRQITAADAQIDRLVYELYGLTGEEIEIVEGTFRASGGIPLS